MSAVTVTRSTGSIGDAESAEATWRPSKGLEPQAIAIETEHLSRTVVDRVLVSDITVQVQRCWRSSVPVGRANRPSCGY